MLFKSKKSTQRKNKYLFISLTVLCIIFGSYGLLFHIRTPNIKKSNSDIFKDSLNINNKKTEDTIQHHNFKIDTTSFFNFKDISYIYNYKIIDTVYHENDEYPFGKTKRIIIISTKKDSIIQVIKVDKIDQPNYYISFDKNEPLFRSQITGKNFKKRVLDDYYGELVIADLNFDGLEDFATPVDHGCNNGSHQAFYIQDKTGHFTLNHFLTDTVTWFPQEINKNKKTLKSITSAGGYGVSFRTFLFDTTSQKWNMIDHYVRSFETGKIERD